MQAPTTEQAPSGIEFAAPPAELAVRTIAVELIADVPELADHHCRTRQANVIVERISGVFVQIHGGSHSLGFPLDSEARQIAERLGARYVPGIEFAALPPAVPAGMFRTARLVTLEKIADLYSNEEITEDDAASRVSRLADPALSDETRWSAFEQLVGALQFRQQVTDGDITVCEVEPELAHPEVLALNAQTAVEDALQELLGSAR